MQFGIIGVYFMVKVWTAFLFICAAASVIAWVVALCHENRVLSEEVGRDFALQLIEPIAERGTNTVKKIDGVIVE